MTPHFLISICDGEQHAPLPGGWFGCDGDGKVPVEGVREEGLSEAAHVGVWAEAVSRVTLKASDKRDGGGQGDADQLRQLQGALRAAAYKDSRTRECRGGGHGSQHLHHMELQEKKV